MNNSRNVRIFLVAAMRLEVFSLIPWKLLTRFGWAVLCLILKNNISGNLRDTLLDFLYKQKQRAVLNRQVSSWDNITEEVPQGSSLGPLYFLLYIKDFTKGPQILNCLLITHLHSPYFMTAITQGPN